MARECGTKELQSISETEEAYWVDVRNTRLVFTTISEGLVLCSASRDSGVFCVRCPYNHAEKRMRWDVLARTHRDLGRLLVTLRRRGIDTTIVSEFQVSQSELLTTRQKQVLVVAFENGFFDFPRKMGLTKMSKELEIDPSTLSETLRTAERKIIHNSILLPEIA